MTTLIFNWLLKALTKPVTWIILIIGILTITLKIYIDKYEKMEKQNLTLLNNLEVALGDVKYYRTSDSAYIAEVQSRFAIMEELLREKDSKLREELKQLGIKKSEVKQIINNTYKIDTTIVRPYNKSDTIIDFSDQHLKAKVFLSTDTSSLDLELKPEIKTFITAEKVPLGKPKKTLVGKQLQEWFGKKRVITKVYTKSYNPYLKFEDSQSVIIDPK